MTLVRWDPLQELVRWSTGTRVDDAFGAWAPAVDIYEKGHDLVIRAEVPGIDKNDIAVDIENGVLTLRGERKREEKKSDGSLHRVERATGVFERSFTLGLPVRADQVKASYKDGVLEVHVPKAEEAKPRDIEVQIN